jgi:hypothetical protein
LSATATDSPFDAFFDTAGDGNVRRRSQEQPARCLGKHAYNSHQQMARPVSFRRKESSGEDDDEWGESGDEEQEDQPEEVNEYYNEQPREVERVTSEEEEEWSDGDSEEERCTEQPAPVEPKRSVPAAAPKRIAPPRPAKLSQAPAVPAKRRSFNAPAKPTRRVAPALPAKSYSRPVAKQSSSEEEWSDGDGGSIENSGREEEETYTEPAPVQRSAPPMPTKRSFKQVPAKPTKRVVPAVPIKPRNAPALSTLGTKKAIRGKRQPRDSAMNLGGGGGGGGLLDQIRRGAQLKPVT